MAGEVERSLERSDKSSVDWFQLADHTITTSATVTTAAGVSTPLISTVTANLAESTTTSLPATEPPPIVSFGRQYVMALSRPVTRSIDLRPSHRIYNRFQPRNVRTAEPILRFLRAWNMDDLDPPNSLI